MATTLKGKLLDLADQLYRNMKPRDRTNAGPFLFEIWIWQELCTFAEARCKAAWKSAVDNGIIAEDDVLRNTAGETIVAESDKFSCVATVATPGRRIDAEDFVENLAKRFKVKVEVIEAIAERSKVDSKAALTKRVLEA